MKHDKDVYTIEAYSDDFLRLLEVAEVAGVRIGAVNLPTSLDILIHEFNIKHCEGVIEYRDIFSDERHMEENFKLIRNYLKDIEVKGSTLVIIDKYIFPRKCCNTYQADLTSLIMASGAKQVIIVTSDEYFVPLKDSIDQSLRVIGVPLQLHVCDEFHDRFWLSLKKHAGFIMGTSLNGVGRGISCINKLTMSDARHLIMRLEELGIR